MQAMQQLDAMLRDIKVTARKIELVTNELQRRHLIHIGKEAERLMVATKTLGTSSERLEGLTITLKTLTLVLVFLTIVAAIVPIGIEVWKAYHEPQTAPVSGPLEPWE